MTDATSRLIPYARAVVACPEGVPTPQRIYSVDDAWLHDGLTENKLSTDGLPLNSIPAIIEPQQFETWPDAASCRGWVSKVKTCQLSDLEGHLRRAWPGGDPPEDANFALRLVEFCLNNRYELCLCSFETLYLDFAHINRSENAILLDIRHQLAATKPENASAWRTNLPDPHRLWGDMTGLGWRLYFHIRLARDGDDIWPHQSLNVDPRHLMIVTSRPDARATVFQRHIIDLARDRRKSLADCHCVLLPKSIPESESKSQRQVEFGDVSDLFDTTFAKAADFKTKKEALIKDVKKAWQEISFAHVDAVEEVRRCNLSVSRWIDGMDDTRKERAVVWDVRALFRPKTAPNPKKDKSKIRAETFWNLLQYLEPGRPAGRATYITAENFQWPEFLPALRPGAFMLLGAARLIFALGEASILLRELSGKVQLKITLGTADHEARLRSFFQERYTRGMLASGATGALCDLLSGMPSLYDEVLKLLPDGEKARFIEELVCTRNGGMRSNLEFQFANDAILLTVGHLPPITDEGQQ